MLVCVEKTAIAGHGKKRSPWKKTPRHLGAISARLSRSPIRLSGEIEEILLIFGTNQNLRNEKYILILHYGWKSTSFLRSRHRAISVRSEEAEIADLDPLSDGKKRRISCQV